VQQAKSVKEFDKLLKDSEQPVIVGFFGDFSATARRARPAFEKFCENHKDQPAVLVDVGRVKGAHKDLGVSTVPTVLLVKGHKVLQKVVGAQTDEYYERALLAPSPVHRHPAGDQEESRPKHRVVLYVGASCPWCSRARSYLRRQGIQFREVDVSRNASESARLSSRSGNQGVPQLDIDGHWIIGFDRPKINTLLGLGQTTV